MVKVMFQGDIQDIERKLVNCFSGVRMLIASSTCGRFFFEQKKNADVFHISA